MGMDADVIGIGPINQKLRDLRALDYSPNENGEHDGYEDILDGIIITSSFFRCTTSSASAELAEALGMDPYNFDQHGIQTGHKIDWDKLREISEYSDWHDNEIESFKEAFKTGWLLFFRPNY